MADESKLLIGILVDEMFRNINRTKENWGVYRDASNCLIYVFDCLNVVDLTTFSRQRLLSAIEIKPDFVDNLERVLRDEYSLQLCSPSPKDIQLFDTGPHHYSRRVFPLCLGASKNVMEYYASCRPKLRY